MPPLPMVSGSQEAKAFGRAGWRFDRQKGSHAILVKPGQMASLSIPQHRELAPGTLRSLIRASGMTVEEFASFL